MVSPKPRILGRLLLDQGRITSAQLEHALREQAKRPRRLGEILLELFFLDEEALARGLAEQLGLPYVAPPLTADPAATRLLKAPLARQWNVLPLQADARALRLVMADPLDIGAVDDVRFHSGRRVDPVVSTQTAVRHGLAQAYGGEWAHLLGQLPSEEPPGSEDLRVLERAASAAPIVRMVDHLLQEAVEAGASDIHLEPDGGRFRVRHRIDGVLRPVTEIPSSAQGAILSRIKIMARMDIAVKRRPQDGGIGLRHGNRNLTLRVSTVPASGGEKAVLRILDPRRAPGGLDRLGLGQVDLTRLRALLKAGQGVLLSAGPTGSGKSSTLYASLREVDRVRQNVVTLEDPIEYRLEGLTQMQVEPRAGLTFPAALRAVLRQDPDVIMVGEIRDRETAEIAMAAAVTGHLVLSTIQST